ncbi:type I-C CRISPR-associated endonuclease Cas1c [Dokdonella soli]|uniref:CRISPR-associated endonuclease Cas1 n=1 Tax=Dokdonella soli TaxID=529810 RepID=A0ABN1ISS7_9GAMM
MSAWTLLNTLYVMTEGSYLRLDNDTVRIEVERETRLRVPLHHLGGIVTLGDDVMLSPALLSRCAESGVSVTLLSRSGRFRARVEGPVSGNVLLRRAQHDANSSPDRTLALSRNILAGKLRNSRTVLLRGAREAKADDDRSALDAAVAKFDASLRAVGVAQEMDALRGVEGEAARTYFAALNRLIRIDARADFAIDGRSRRPPRDAFNALLSFLYTLLVHDCRSALETVGLDPQIGFLHVLRPGRPALALDLVEEFRAIAADRMALTLINRGQLKASDFRTTEGGGVLMADDARRTVSIAWQERKKETLMHPLLESEVPLGLLPQIQARLLARTLRGEMEAYLPFIAR